MFLKAFVFSEDEKDQRRCGRLTMEAIQEGFDQGRHAADPGDDGLGREDRVGLANVVERGNVQALCEFIQNS